MGVVIRLLYIVVAALFQCAPALATEIDNIVRTTGLITNPTSVLTRPSQIGNTTTSTSCTTNYTGTFTANTFQNGQTVTFNAAPCATTGPQTGIVYFVIGGTGTTIQVSATLGGSAVTASGTVTNAVLVNLVYAYPPGQTAGDLIASSATAPTVPTITAARTSGGNFYIPRMRLVTNATSGWNNAPMLVNIFTSGPTYTGGDAAPYNVLTGAANQLGAYSCTMTQYTDGAWCSMIPINSAPVGIALASGQTITWDLQYTGSPPITSVASTTWTVTLEDWQN